jgi:hypothetical protein
MADGGISGCAHCKKPVVTHINSVPLCVDCYYKFEVARTLEFRMLAINANHASAEMASIIGVPNSFPKMQVPDIPKGPPILNNIKIDNSVVGAINTGTVQSIDVNISRLEQSGNDQVSEKLKTLTQAIANEPSLGDRDKNHLLDQVAYLSEQATSAAKDRKPGMIHAAFAAVGQTATTVAAVATAWKAAEPLLSNLLR